MPARAEHIVDAAEAIARESGMPAVSVRAVAARAAVGIGTLRHYFPRQRDLHDAVADRLLRQELSDLRIADRDRPTAERLSECLAQFLPPSQDEVGHLVAWLRMYAAAVDPQAAPGVERTVATLDAGGRRMVRGWLETLDAEGVLTWPGDHDELVTLLLSVVSGLCLILVTPDTTLTVDRAHALLAESVRRLGLTR